MLSSIPMGMGQEKQSITRSEQSQGMLEQLLAWEIHNFSFFFLCVLSSLFSFTPWSGWCFPVSYSRWGHITQGTRKQQVGRLLEQVDLVLVTHTSLFLLSTPLLLSQQRRSTLVGKTWWCRLAKQYGTRACEGYITQSKLLHQEKESRKNNEPEGISKTTEPREASCHTWNMLVHHQ